MAVWAIVGGTTTHTPGAVRETSGLASLAVAVLSAGSSEPAHNFPMSKYAWITSETLFIQWFDLTGQAISAPQQLAAAPQRARLLSTCLTADNNGALAIAYIQEKPPTSGICWKASLAGAIVSYPS